MEFSVVPRGFNVAEVKVPQPNNEFAVAMRLTFLDVSGTPVHVTFSMPDWAAFQRYVADPEAETARQAARSKLVVPPPNGLAH